ncbi:MAG: alkaline phosphatase family protein [Bryobacteraceae bacterium]|nr:alkaline phosphatase family protein [Bryobacteraceae bacterium]
MNFRAITLLLLASSHAFAQTPVRKPKLVVLIAVDQFRYDYLARFRDEYKGGLDRLLRNGANYVNAHLEHYPTVTAIGHSTMLSGATPNTSGIIANDWFDRASGKTVTSVSDDGTKQLGGSNVAGASPRRMLVSTLGDEMKRARPGTKVIGLSLKDRSSVLPAGHMADAAYWYDTKTGDMVSSTYYFPALPEWAKAFNQRRLVDKYAGLDWVFDKSSPKGTKKMSPVGEKLSAEIYSSPFGNELLEQFAEEAVRREKLGQRGLTDLLTLSFSSNDAIGHDAGPDSPQVHDVSVRTDAILAKFFGFLEQTVGMQNVLVILTADHGVTPVPEVLAQDKMPGGRLPGAAIFGPMEKALEESFGPGKWMLSSAGSGPYLNWDLIRERKLDAREVERVAASAVAQIPHIARVLTRHQILQGDVVVDRFSQRVLRSFHPQRSPDLEILLDPYWLRTAVNATGTTHGSPFSYDSHIPLIFMGPGIKPGRYVRNVALNDLAASLATILNVETPSGSAGQPLTEMMP